MHPTELPAWLMPQSRYSVLWSPDMARASQHGRPSTRLAAVFNFQNNPNLHFVGLDDMLNSKHMTRNELLKRFKLSTDLWNPNIAPNIPTTIDLQRYYNHNYIPGSDMVPPLGNSVVTSQNKPVGSGGFHGQWPVSQGPSGVAIWGGWAAGAVLLALLVLFVRAAETCVDKRLFKSRRRRQSEEWPAANVRATSLQQNVDLDSMPHLDGSEFSSPSQCNSDLPPPYSECASINNVISNPNMKTSNRLTTEEPPPPYSACVVAFSNSDIPTVHIQCRRQIGEPQSSLDIDNVRNNLIESHHTIESEHINYDQDIMRVELVFDNGRIVERTIDVDNSDVPEIVAIVADVGDAVIRSGNSDDNITCNDDDITDDRDQERIVLV